MSTMSADLEHGRAGVEADVRIGEPADSHGEQRRHPDRDGPAQERASPPTVRPRSSPSRARRPGRNQAPRTRGLIILGHRLTAEHLADDDQTDAGNDDAQDEKSNRLDPDRAFDPAREVGRFIDVEPETEGVDGGSDLVAGVPGRSRNSSVSAVGSITSGKERANSDVSRNEFPCGPLADGSSPGAT